MPWWLIVFIIGYIAALTFVLALCKAAAKGDRQMEKLRRHYQDDER